MSIPTPDADEMNRLVKQAEAERVQRISTRSAMAGLIACVAFFLVALAAILIVGAINGYSPRGNTEVGLGVGAFFVSFPVGFLAGLIHYFVATRADD